jgi:heptosyltransferase III
MVAGARDLPPSLTGRPLVVRFAAFGDVVLLTPLIEALYQRYRQPVDVLAIGGWTTELLQDDPAVGQIQLITSRKTPYMLCPSQRQAVRWLQECMVNGTAGPVYLCDPEPQALKLLARAGIPSDHIVRAWDDWCGPTVHWVDWWLQVAQRTPRAFAHVPPGPAVPAHPRLHVGQRKQDACDTWLTARGWNNAPLILIQAGNKRTMKKKPQNPRTDNKYWPAQHWAAVIDAVGQAMPGVQILLCGVPDEHAVLAEIVAHCRYTGVHNLTSELPIARLLPLMRRAHSMISVDTGPAHAAAALGCPLVVMFGLMSSTRWLPRSPGSAVIALESGKGERAAVADFTPDQVIAAWRQLLSQ